MRTINFYDDDDDDDDQLITFKSVSRFNYIDV